MRPAHQATQLASVVNLKFLVSRENRVCKAVHEANLAHKTAIDRRFGHRRPIPELESGQTLSTDLQEMPLAQDGRVRDRFPAIFANVFWHRVPPRAEFL